MAWPYCPRPPDWRMNLPSPSAALVMVSRYAIFVARRVAGPDVAQADQRRNVAREDLFNVLSLAALDNHQTADPLALAAARIVNRFAFLEGAGINAEENQLAGVSVGPQLERERTKLVAVAGLDRNDIIGARLAALGRRDVQRTGKIIDHGVKQGLDALLLEGRPAQHRNQLDLAGQSAYGGFEHAWLGRPFLDQQLGHRVVLVGDGVDQLGERRFGLLLEVIGDFFDLVLEPFVHDLAGAPDDRLLTDHIDDAFELILFDYVQVNRLDILADI